MKSDNEFQILTTLGRIDERTERIEKHVLSQEKRIKKLEMTWGKITALITALSFPVTYFWKKLTKQPV